MLRCKLENPHMTDIGPIMEIRLYKEDGTRSEYGAAIAPYYDSIFMCYRMHNDAITQSNIGNSRPFPFGSLVKDGSIIAKHKKAIIHGEIALAIIDFLGVISDLMKEDILSPNEVSIRFGSPEITKYIDLCYKYFKDL